MSIKFDSCIEIKWEYIYKKYVDVVNGCYQRQAIMVAVSYILASYPQLRQLGPEDMHRIDGQTSMNITAEQSRAHCEPDCKVKSPRSGDQLTLIRPWLLHTAHSYI